MMKIAIVGATGPTGIHLVTELRKSVATVRVIARSTDKLARLFPEAALEKLSADILDADATLRAVDGCDIVYDCIGLPGDQMHLHPLTARNKPATSDRVTLTIERLPEGKMQVTSNSWDHERVLPRDQVLEVR